jgi:hypothetical protein
MGTTTGLIWAGAVVVITLDVILFVYLVRRYGWRFPFKNRRVRGFTRLPPLSLRVAIDVAREFCFLSK